MLAVKNRDWSQVLGAAAFTGFAPASLDRATQRCGSLFEETMSWRRLREHDSISDHAGEAWTGGRTQRQQGTGVFNPNRPFITQDGFMQELVDVGRREGRKGKDRSRRVKRDGGDKLIKSEELGGAFVDLSANTS